MTALVMLCVSCPCTTNLAMTVDLLNVLHSSACFLG